MLRGGGATDTNRKGQNFGCRGDDDIFNRAMNVCPHIGGRGEVCAGRQEKRLVAAEADASVGVASAGGKDPSKKFQRIVSDLMAITVVVLLKAVHVDNRDRQRIPCAAKREAFVQKRLHFSTVIKTGERIGFRQLE